MQNKNVETVERFHEKWTLNKETGCWEWNASLNANGYGQMKRPGERTNYLAHRLSYEIHYGQIPEDKMVCHTCDNPKCVKPSHLFIGTALDNNRDAASKERSTMHNARLNPEKVEAILLMSEQGISQSKIGRSFGVNQQAIFKIVHGLRWKHVYTKFQAGAALRPALKK